MQEERSSLQYLRTTPARSMSECASSGRVYRECQPTNSNDPANDPPQTDEQTDQSGVSSSFIELPFPSSSCPPSLDVNQPTRTSVTTRTVGADPGPAPTATGLGTPHFSSHLTRTPLSDTNLAANHTNREHDAVTILAAILGCLATPAPSLVYFL